VRSADGQTANAVSGIKINRVKVNNSKRAADNKESELLILSPIKVTEHFWSSALLKPAKIIIYTTK
jgi:hypothetical protein